MPSPEADRVRHVATIGAGPIGAGWAAHFLAQGFDVTAYIHAWNEEPVFRKILDIA